ncbi:MAG: glycosyltransferase [Deltaproteobacteria bacterium]|nr:glycosyltransferase [Deltaproteobacteria bacterium]
MRIACISDDRYPTANANTQQIVKTAAALARRGLDVDLVLPRLWETLGQDEARRRQSIEQYYSAQGPFGLRQILSWMPTPLRFHKFSHGIVGPVVTGLDQYDLVYTRNFLPVLVGLATGQRVMFETYRLLGRQYPALKDSMRRVGGHRNFLGVVVHSDLARDVMIESGVPADKVAVIHNGYDPSDLEPRLTRAEARRVVSERTGWALEPEAKIVCYTGRIDPDKGIDVVLDMAARSPKVTYLFVGATNRRGQGWLDRACLARGVTNVLRSPRVDPKTLAAFMYAADVLIIPPTCGPLVKKGNTVLPIKTFSYLGAGRPILAPDLPDTAGLLQNDENAVLVPADDSDWAVRALLDLLADSKRWMRLAQGAGRSGEGLTYDARAERFEAFMRERLAIASSVRP